MAFKEYFVHTPHGKLFGVYHSKHAYFTDVAFYYDSLFLDFVQKGDLSAQELWSKARDSGLPMMYLGEE